MIAADLLNAEGKFSAPVIILEEVSLLNSIEKGIITL